MNRVFNTSRIPRLSALVLPLAVLFSTLMIGSASADTPSVCNSAFGSFSSTNFPGACWRPYSSGSPFNRQLPADPTIASDSASIVANLSANSANFEGGGQQFAFTSDDGRDGVYYSSPSDPLVTIDCTYYWGPGTCSGSDKVNIDGQQIHIPAGAMPQSNGSDMHMTVFDQVNQVEYDFEHATWSSDHKTLIVWAGAEIPAGPNVGTGLGGGGTAAGTATPAGLITEPQLASGTINHALSINLPCTNGSVYPSDGANGLACSQISGESTAGTVAPLGTLLQLNMTDAQIAASGAPAWEQTIMTAMAHYGMYVNDTDGLNEIELEAESDVSYTSLGGQPLMSNFISAQGGWYYSPLSRWIMEGPGIPLNKLRVVDPCWAQGLCAGSGTTTPPTSTPPPTTTPPSAPPATTTTTTTTTTPVATTPVSTNPVSTTPVSTTPTPVSTTPTPVATKPAPAKPTPVKHTPRKQPKPRKSSSVARIASVNARSCKAAKASRGAKKTAKRAVCASAVKAAKRRAAARR
jgi:hypothetical protein